MRNNRKVEICLLGNDVWMPMLESQTDARFQQLTLIARPAFVLDYFGSLLILGCLLQDDDVGFPFVANSFHNVPELAEGCTYDYPR